MNIQGQRVVILGGAGLVGMAIARQMLRFRPSRLVIGGLREDEAVGAVTELEAELEREAREGAVELVPAWGDLFLREEHKAVPRGQLLADPETREELLVDLFGTETDDLYAHSALIRLLERHRPAIVVDCINTATAIAYQDIFASASRIRRLAVAEGSASLEEVEAHLSILYLPQLIRHVQLLLEGLRRAGTEAYLKVGTSGTGGMGLNVPFTHSERRPSRPLLAKASVAGAHSSLLFLLGRTPGAPSVTEIKPTAAIAWKKIAYGPIRRGGRPIPRVDATRPVRLGEAFGADVERSWEEVGESLESVYIDTGENGLFSLGEFEAISTLRLMELVTPEEIADVAIDEIRGRPTGRDVVSALDACVMGPTYRGGMLRDVALEFMERLEKEHDVRSVAFELLGPPRLSKLLFEAYILERLFPDLEAAVGLDPADTSDRAAALIESDRRLRSDILSIGLPILLPDGETVLRGPRVGAEPAPGAEPRLDRWAAQGWVDLRPDCWVQWRDRCGRFARRRSQGPGPERGSVADFDVRSASGAIRPGALAADVFLVEDKGERTKG